MTLHLIKLSVGTDSIEDLEDWIKLKLKERKKRRQKPERIHTTRMFPKRVDDLLDGGSIYWVIKGEILCRERILDLRQTVGKDGISRCQLVLDPKLVRSDPALFRTCRGPAAARREHAQAAAHSQARGASADSGGDGQLQDGDVRRLPGAARC